MRRVVGVDCIEATLILHVWSRTRGRKEVKQITAEIHRVLHDANLTVTGHDLIWLRFEQSRTLLDVGGAPNQNMPARNKAIKDWILSVILDEPYFINPSCPPKRLEFIS